LGDWQATLNEHGSFNGLKSGPNVSALPGETLPLLERRHFLKLLAMTGAGSAIDTALSFARNDSPSSIQEKYAPGRIPNEYSLFLPGEEASLKTTPTVSQIQSGKLTATVGGRTAVIHVGDALDGWQLLTIGDMNGVATGVFEKHLTHRGAILYVTVARGVIANIPKQIGDLSKIRPRPTNTSQGVWFERAPHYVPGPDVPGKYMLNSSEDPSYENVAALGPEYIGWTLVANEQGGPRLRCTWSPMAGRGR
jgi:hypothetical protein